MPAAPQRALRTQGKRTQARLLEAGLRVLGERGYQATRVDDVVRAAETSHGTFYLYFENKDDLFRALAHAAADEMAALADELGDIGPDAAGLAELRTFLGRFAETYERHGAVIRAWAENQVDDPVLITLGLDTFGGIAAVLGDHMRSAGVDHLPDEGLAVTILLGTIERLVYYLSSRPIGLESDAVLDELAGVLHRGFFVNRSRAARSPSTRTSRRSR